jgi:dephospho-CoA kinase
MLNVGITGGIGSGKTTVCCIFEAMGVPVFYADIKAKQLYDKPDIYQKVQEMFGLTVFTDGVIDKKKLASRVFSDKDALQKLNDLIHPVVSAMYDKWSLQYTDKPYVIEEAALLFESGIYKKFDVNVLVTAPVEIRINRIMQRDNNSREAVIQRMENQMSDEEKKLLANKTIINDGSIMVMPQIIKLHSELIEYR